MAELRRMADQCEFGAYLQDALRDRLVCGMHSETIRDQRRLLTEEHLTLAKAYSTAHGMEIAKKAKELQAPSINCGERPSEVQYMQKQPPRWRELHLHTLIKPQAPPVRSVGRLAIQLIIVTSNTKHVGSCGKKAT